MAFMFETRWVMRPTRHALDTPCPQPDDNAVWADLSNLFRATRP